MQSVTVSTTIARPRELVFDHLDDLARHEAFTDHFLVDWNILSDDSVGVGAAARRRTSGTYRLEPAGDGGTTVTFTNAFEPATLGERLQAPLARAYLRRQNGRALQRLKALLEEDL